MTLTTRAAQAAATIITATAAVLTSASLAAALTGSIEGAPKARAVAGQAIAFDWRAGKPGSRRAGVVPVSASVRSGLNLGGGSYVCSPAGFGRQSSCFAR